MTCLGSCGRDRRPGFTLGLFLTALHVVPAPSPRLREDTSACLRNQDTVPSLLQSRRRSAPRHWDCCILSAKLSCRTSYRNIPRRVQRTAFGSLLALPASQSEQHRYTAERALQRKILPVTQGQGHSRSHVVRGLVRERLSDESALAICSKRTIKTRTFAYSQSSRPHRTIILQERRVHCKL